MMIYVLEGGDEDGENDGECRRDVIYSMTISSQK
jgi:hypothetical protein